MENHNDFLKRYEVFQNRKFDPKVFADETTPPRSPKEAEYMSWYQQNRFHYYSSQGRLSDLRGLEKARNWPNLPNLMTSVSLTRSVNRLGHHLTNPGPVHANASH